MNGSLAGEVIVKVYVNGRNIVEFLRDLELFIFLRVVDYAIFPQIQIHIEGLLLPLPRVAPRMYVNLFVSIQNLPQSFLLGH